jgi:hypothetical protein
MVADVSGNLSSCVSLLTEELQPVLLGLIAHATASRIKRLPSTTPQTRRRSFRPSDRHLLSHRTRRRSLALAQLPNNSPSLSAGKASRSSILIGRRPGPAGCWQFSSFFFCLKNFSFFIRFSHIAVYDEL